MAETMAGMFSKLAGYSFFLSTIKQLLPPTLDRYFDTFWFKILALFNPNIEIRIDEYTSSELNEAYSDTKTYLGAISTNQKAKYLKAEKLSESKSVVISLDEGEEIIDNFKGIKLKWKARKGKIEDNSSRRGGPSIKEKNFYVLRFHKKDREIVTMEYLDYVIKEGKSITYKNRRRKLYTNKILDKFWRYRPGGKWNGISFEHPTTFDTVALDPKKKQEIINDLTTFRGGKDYYKSIGKAWKRGYLLYGPPGTGKSSMICAIANFMEYDIYDLELTLIEDNSELKELLIDTKGQSVIVIEDIDCSIDLTGKRKSNKNDKVNDDEDSDSDSDSEEEDEKSKKKKKKEMKVTLSGLLNVIDGIWSACGPERIIIFTTNHVKKLDPALIRRGRMDMHIEMSYCRFEAFKVLAKNYLGIDTHPLFGQIENLLEEKDVSPCDVAENLMPKTNPKDVDACLNTLIQTCQEAAKRKSKAAAKKEAKKTKVPENFDQKPQEIKEEVEEQKVVEINEVVEIN